MQFYMYKQDGELSPIVSLMFDDERVGILHVHQAKTQIGLRINSGCSASSLSACRRFGPLATHRVPCKVCADAQADLSLCWAHMQSYRKCYVPVTFFIFLQKNRCY